MVCLGLPVCWDGGIGDDKVLEMRWRKEVAWVIVAMGEELGSVDLMSSIGSEDTMFDGEGGERCPVGVVSMLSESLEAPVFTVKGELGSLMGTIVERSGGVEGD